MNDLLEPTYFCAECGTKVRVVPANGAFLWQCSGWAFTVRKGNSGETVPSVTYCKNMKNPAIFLDSQEEPTWVVHASEIR